MAVDDRHFFANSMTQKSSIQDLEMAPPRNTDAHDAGNAPSRAERYVYNPRSVEQWMARLTTVRETRQESPLVDVVLYPNVDGRPNPQRWRLDQLRKRLVDQSFFGPSRPRTGRCISLVRLKDGATQARDEDVEGLTGLCLDFDDGTTQRQIEEGFARYRYFAHCTYRHTEPQPRWRVVLPFAAEHDPSALARMYGWVESLGLKPDWACCNSAHKFFLPVRPANAEFISWSNQGELLDLRHLRSRPRIMRLREQTEDVHFTQNPANFAPIIRALGASPGTRVGQKICSLVTKEENPSTWFFVSKSGHLLYYSAHAREVVDAVPGGGFLDHKVQPAAAFSLSCAEVLASQAYGKIIRFKNPRQPQHKLWDLRLQYKLGLLRPLPVPHAEFDPQHNRLRSWKTEELQQLRDVYEGFLLMVGLKAAYNGRGIEASPFAWRFAAAWCGVGNKDTAGGLIRALMEMQLIRSAGTATTKFGYSMHLLLPHQQNR